MKTYFLVDVLRRRAMGPLTRAQLLYQLFTNSGVSDIRDAQRQFGVTVVEESNLFELEEEYRTYADTIQSIEVKS